MKEALKAINLVSKQPLPIYYYTPRVEHMCPLVDNYCTKFKVLFYYINLYASNIGKVMFGGVSLFNDIATLSNTTAILVELQ